MALNPGSYSTDGYSIDGYFQDPVQRLVSYTNLITSEHADKPNFMATIAATCQPFVDIQNAISLFSLEYDVDNASGVQLDVVGQWVGVSRYLTTPLTGVYFTLDTAGSGLDSGLLIGPYDPIAGVISLPDNYYRLLIKSRILNDHWDGSVPAAYALANTFLSNFGLQLAIIDHGDLTMSMGVIGSIAPLIVQALLLDGRLDIKPAGMSIYRYFYYNSSGIVYVTP